MVTPMDTWAKTDPPAKSVNASSFFFTGKTNAPYLPKRK